ncbi:SpoU rRNA Methylase family protein [Bifidobacterium bohemicum]|uniref:rRNA methyltransferase n=1 Tax=Bifidobacterium bohemicum DSM 22767 TaxID=1437606 RepID=A0A086ZEX8_9BIFI|nr:TrmH family RNA methyltransferase [Bifidobacterium bohemicum]KFI45078.1 rRNA methyltransferase [Bifidobacterium bohemicum DSM 22767]SCB92132.1 SpoU rRNA Methylase family protein [Bifidobacterium bohemicum]
MREPNPITAAAQASGEPEFRQIGVGPWVQTHPGQPRPDDRQSPYFDERFDPELLDNGDRRNVLDKYRYWSVPAIKADLDQQGRHGFEVAVENWTHDFNIGSMVRTANAFAAKSVHIVGPHKWNRKGALMTELYQHIDHHPSIEQLVTSWREGIAAELVEAEQQLAANKADMPASEQGESALRIRELTSDIADLKAARIIALDIIPGAVPIETYRFPKRCLMLFGAEGPGLSQKALELADDVVYISQFGSVRSINAGAAAAVAMHCWISQRGV